MGVRVADPGLLVGVVSVSTVGGAVSLHEVGLITTSSAASDAVAQNTVGRTRFADFGGGVQEVVPATFKHTVSLQDGVGRLTVLTLSWTSTLQTVVITAETSVSVLIGTEGASLCADAVLQDVSLHALQAVGPQRTFAGVTAPVTLSAGAGRGVEVVLVGAAVVLTLSEQQHLGRVAARSANAGRVARQALAVARLTGPMAVVIVTEGTAGSTET